MKMKQIDIHSKGEYPANVLSNFYPNEFIFDGVRCASMEGLLQSLKTKNKKRAELVRSYSGKHAKMFFSRKPQNLRWKLTGKLYWNGRAMSRYSDEYQRFLDEAFFAMCQNPCFSKALADAAQLQLSHSIGKTDERDTVLTEYEFISRLQKCRERVLCQKTDPLTEKQRSSDIRI